MFNFNGVPSLAFRVTSTVSVTTILVFLSLTWLSSKILDDHLTNIAEEELGVIVNSVISALDADLNKADTDTLQNAVRGHHGVHYFVADSTGSSIYSDDEGPNLAHFSQMQLAMNSHANVASTTLLANGRHYLATVQKKSLSELDEQHIIIAAAIDMQEHHEFKESFNQLHLLATAFAAGFSILVAWLSVRWGHTPIQQLSQKINSITTSELGIRLDASLVPIELKDTVVSVNQMLEKIETGFLRLSEFTADIAHELRTPITNIYTQIEVALRRPRNSEEYKEILYSILEELSRFKRMIDEMLFIAQADNRSLILDVGYLDLADLVKNILEFFEGWCTEKGVNVYVQGTVAPVTADREMIARALNNLLSNAIKNSSKGGDITIQLRQDYETTTISVSNQGSSIAKADVDRIFDRFYRGQSERGSTGSGLGLAIVRSIAALHGGDVSVKSTEAETTFSLTIPNTSKLYSEM